MIQLIVEDQGLIGTNWNLNGTNYSRTTYFFRRRFNFLANFKIILKVSKRTVTDLTNVALKVLKIGFGS